MASAYLSRTFGTPTNASKFTYSGWIKRSGLGGNQVLLYANGGNSQNFSNIMFNSGNNFFWHVLHSNSEVSKLRTNAALRDTNAWYHLVFQYDSTQATANNRTKMYINGVEVTSYGTQTNSGQNSNYHMNTAVEHFIGAEKGNTGGSVGSYFDGQMAHVHFVDGTIYAPSTFGETDATTGIWKPKVSPTGITYGNNGFFLKFDNSANMGLDSSGNSNNWTTSGTIIQVPDTPSNIFATINPLDNYYQNNTFSNINNTVASHSSSYSCCLSTLGVSKGKYYVEAKVSALTAAVFGVTGKSPTSTGNNLGTSGFGIGVGENGRLRHEGTNTDSWSSTYTTNDILQVALDLDNNKFYFGINGTYQNSANPSTGSNGVTILAPSSTDTGLYFFGFSDNNSTGGSTLQYNFGQGFFGTTAVASAQTPDDGIGVFEYDPPTGYRALCTKSLNAQEYS